MGPFSRQARVEALAALKRERVELQAQASSSWMFGAIAIVLTLLLGVTEGTFDQLGVSLGIMLIALILVILGVLLVAARAARRATKRLAQLERQIVLLEQSIAEVPAGRGFWWRVFAP